MIPSTVIHMPLSSRNGRFFFFFLPHFGQVLVRKHLVQIKRWEPLSVQRSCAQSQRIRRADRASSSQTHAPSGRQSRQKSESKMDGQAQISSPPFHTNPSDASLPPPRSRPGNYPSIRSDITGSQDQAGVDGYDSNRSPSGSATMGDGANAKRRKVNHGKR